MNVAIVDYRAGNLASVVKALTAVGADPHVVGAPGGLRQARAIVIPGVGHFSATSVLDEMRPAIRECIDSGIPVLGICLGMQWLFDGSEEAPALEGLGWFPGQCARLEGPVKVPHVGWNTLARTKQPSRLLKDLPPDAFAYFSHTFAPPACAHATATTTHGATFPAVVERENVFGAQFHPEKSGRAGLQILINFVALAHQVKASC